MIRRTIILCSIFYILGLALGFIFNPPSARAGIYLWLFAAFLVLPLAGTLLSVLSARRMEPPLLFSLLAAGFLFLGLYQYTTAMDTSSAGHIVHYLDKTQYGDTLIRGVVIRDPDIRESYINLMVRPYEVKLDPLSERTLKINKGNIIIRLRPSLRNYYHYDYADKIEVRGNLSAFPPAGNPGTLDMRNFYIHQDIWGIIQVNYDRDIKLIGKEAVNAIQALSYRIKDRMLLTFKKTMRYPESAFLGGVTLGLRTGLSYEVQDEFRATGIAHVLAVSGLHVGFIALFLVTLFSLFRIPRSLSTPLICFGLALFTYITGAAPATIRAALMFGLITVLSTYSKGRWTSDLNLTLFSVGLLYLLFNPLMVVEPSFVMSYTAILSISLLAEPMTRLLTRYVTGYVFLAFLIAFILLTLFLIVPYLARLLLSTYLVPLAFILFLYILFRIAGQWNRKKPSFRFGMASLGKVITGFMGVQFGITLGNVFPISALYFQRVSLAGLYANWIAIPLIGIIVQMGIIAGVLGFVWTPLAFLVNAGNYIYSWFFLAMAHFFAVSFPYPVVPRPTFFALCAYYAAVFLLVFYPRVKLFLNDLYYRILYLWEKAELVRDLRLLLVSLLAILLIGCSYMAEHFLPENRLRITFIDTRALSRFGDGSAFLLEMPGKKSMLINSGPGYFNFGDFVSELNVGDTVVRPLLSFKRITTLDYLILQNIGTEAIGGVPVLLKNFRVKKILSSYPLDRIIPRIRKDIRWWTVTDEQNHTRFSREIGKGGELKLSSQDKIRIKKIIESAQSKGYNKKELIRSLFKKSVPGERARQIADLMEKEKMRRQEEEKPALALMEKILGLSGNEKEELQNLGLIIQLMKERGIAFENAHTGLTWQPARKVTVSVLGPEKDLSFQDDRAKSIVLRIAYCGRTILLAGRSDGAAINRLLSGKKDLLKCDILSIPDYGSSASNPYSFIKAASPRYAVCHYYYKRGRKFEKDVYLNYACRGSRFFRTDTDGAVEFTVSGRRIKCRPWISAAEDQTERERKKYEPGRFGKNDALVRIYCPDTGEGSSYLITTPGGKNFLINGGRAGDEEEKADAGRGVVLPLLKKLGIKKLDGVFIQNRLPSSCGGLISVLDQIPFGTAWEAEAASGASPEYDGLKKLIIFKNGRLKKIRKGDLIKLDDSAAVQVLYPDRQTAAPEEGAAGSSSLVMKLVYRKFSMLFTGDINGGEISGDGMPSPGSAEHALLSPEYSDSLKSLVMTVPGQGNRKSATLPLLKKIRPDLALLAVPRFERFLPSDDVLTRYAELVTPVLRTGEQGGIILATDGELIEIRREGL